MAAPAFVKGPAGQYFSDLVQACEDHFSRIYPDYVDSLDHDTVMCPSVFPFGYIAPTGQASGATPLNDIEKASIDGDNAELKIFHMLEKFGKETNQPMFVLAQVKITEFIKNVLRQKLPADHPILVDKLNLEGEIDFLIIHRQIGVILIEVKAPKKFSKSTQSKARKQLQIGEEIIHALSHADHKIDHNESTIPVYKVIAMPNVSDPGRENQNFISLREVNVRSDGNFVRWWENKFAKRMFGSHEKRELQNLIYIFVAQKCEVSSKVLSDVCKKIDQQKFLHKSYEKGTKKGGDGSQAIVKTADRPEQAILAKQFLFLNPDQLRIWNGPRHQFFNGSSGSGKTILLQFKAWTQFVKNYDVSNHLGHHVCGPSVTVFENSDFDFITQVVQNEINKWAESDSLYRVAVLVTTSFPKERLGHLMVQKGIAVCDIADNQKNAVVLDFGHKAHSYEWPVVVAISWFNNDLSSNYIMFTRAVSRLVVITSGDVPL